MNSIIIDNYITLLRAGAFKSKNNEILPMSLHKWHILGNMAKEHHVQTYLADGMALIKDSDPDNAKNLPSVDDVGLSTHTKYDVEGNFDASKAYLVNSISKRRWEELREEEMNDIENISDETLQLLDIIIMNADYTIDTQINVEGILFLGRFLRMNKELIDPTKLNHWLRQTKMTSMANMQGTILSYIFDFPQDEIPFLTKPYHKAEDIFMQTLDNTFEKHRIPLFTCLELAALETIYCRFSGAISIVRDVEE
jgi:hypothetical protein